MSTRRKELEEATKAARARDADERALKLWDERQRGWTRMAANIATKVGKPADEVLHVTTHRWREKVEELDLIEAAVPQVMKSGNSWEMSLRGGADGVRYVKFGSSFPYPLYCPVRNRDLIDGSCETFTKVVAKDAVADKKSGGDTIKGSDPFQQRFREFRKNIAKRFPHRLHDIPKDGLCVSGIPPPVTSEPPPEEDGAPVQHYEFEELPPTPGGYQEQSGQEEVVMVGDASAAAEGQVGPLLSLATSRLLFQSEPTVLAQSSLRVNNMGTTAIFFNWRKLPDEPVLDKSGKALSRSPCNPRVPFELCGATSGALLPGDEHSFTFVFRQDVPCVVSEQWELQTVPAGAERIVIHLRGVVIAQETDPVSSGFLSRHLDQRVREHMIGGFFTELLNRAPLQNAFDRSMEEAEGRAQEEKVRQAAEEELARKEQGRKSFHRANESALRCDPCDDKWKAKGEFESVEAWEAAEGTPPLYFHEAVFDKLSRLHQNAQRLVAALDGLPEPTLSRWSGSTGEVAELLQSIPDAQVRRPLQLASSALVSASRHDHAAPRSEYPDLQSRWEEFAGSDSVLPVMLYATTHRALTSAMMEMHDRSVSIQEQLGMIEAPTRGAAKGKGAKPPPKAKAVKQEEEPSPEEVKEQHRKRLEDETRQILGNAIEQGLTLWDQQRDLLDAAADADPVVAFADVIQARQVQREEAAAAAAARAGATTPASESATK
eukprot:Hpha_TRINITY_DN15018_c11_g8::TRINITY_DN15018_c11_g8_i1::g.124828::m.124828